MEQKILITKDNESFFFKDQDLHTKWGYIKKLDIEKASLGDKLTTNKGKDMYVSQINFKDQYNKLRRGAQIMLPKDICTIIGVTGITKDSRILDSGSGSGGNACLLASLVKKVYTYDIREDHCNITKKNAEMLKLKNLTIKNKDVYEKIDEKNIDVAVFDLPEPWRIIENAFKTLKHGGFVVTYSPHITQVSKFVDKIREDERFIFVKTIEVMQREWEIDGVKARPKFRMLGHTAFLTFARKL